MQRAIDAFQRATVADPTYALGWANLAMAYGTSPINSDVDPRRVFPAARDAALRAVAANPDVAEAQHALGHVKWAFDWDWSAAEAAFRRAIDLDPSYSLVHLVLAHLLSQTGRHAEALKQLDPPDPSLSQDDLVRWVDQWRLASSTLTQPAMQAAGGASIRVALGSGRDIEFRIAARTPDLVIQRTDEGLDYHFPARMAALLVASPSETGATQR
jgi:hypothetical protein